MKRLVAEFIGTFALVFAGTGAIVINDVSGGAITHVGIALTFGLIVLAMIYTIGDISGAHLNPAVTGAFWLSGRFSGQQVLQYVLAQCLGAIAASGILLFLFPTHGTLGATLPAGSDTQSFVLELILTLILMFVILNVSAGAKEKGVTAGMAVGAVIGLEAMFTGPISGASMNPARSLAPALLSGHLEHLWIYLAAPLIGACLAVFACRGCQDSACCPTDANMQSIKPIVLILCTGNSCRSHMAEGFLRAAAGEILDVQSAGSKPAGCVHPLAIKVMQEAGIDISQHQSKHLSQFLDRKIETVITVCGNADQACPIFPGQVNRYHWAFCDPPKPKAATKKS